MTPSISKFSRSCKKMFLNYFLRFHSAILPPSQMGLFAYREPHNSSSAQQKNLMKWSHHLFASCQRNSSFTSPVDGFLLMDFSINRIGAVSMFTTSTDFSFKPSRFHSRSLKDAESRYRRGSYSQFMQCQPDIIKSSKTIIYNDHQPLVGAYKKYSPEAQFSSRLSRILAMISIFVVQFKYIDGQSQILADFISRSVVGKAAGLDVIMCIYFDNLDLSNAEAT